MRDYAFRPSEGSVKGETSRIKSACAMAAHLDEVFHETLIANESMKATM